MSALATWELFRWWYMIGTDTKAIWVLERKLNSPKIVFWWGWAGEIRRVLEMIP